MRALQRVLLVALAVLSVRSYGLAGLISTSVEPIIGYERYQKLIPTPHTRERLVVGARILVGIPFVSAEGEYTRGTDSESFSTNPTLVREVEDKARIGARSTFRLGGFLSLFARGGVQAKAITRDTVISGVSIQTKDPVRFNPYAGAGLRIGMGGHLALTADISVVFRSFPDMSQNDYMTTAGITVSFP